MDIHDKVVLITGSAIRVGKAIAMTFAKKGARTIIHYRSSEKEAEATAAEIAAVGHRPLVVQGDVSRREDWERMHEEIMTAYGRLDVLVNNAAIFYKTPFLDATEKDWDQFMNINLKSVFHGSQVFGKGMMAQGSGKIINIADVSAEKVWPTYIPYCVSKAGIVAMTRGLAKALAPAVTVNAVAPGTVLLAESYDEQEEQALIDKTPLKRVGEAQDIANTVVFLVEGSDFISGQVIGVDGGRSLV